MVEKGAIYTSDDAGGRLDVGMTPGFTDHCFVVAVGCCLTQTPALFSMIRAGEILLDREANCGDYYTWWESGVESEE